jgi:hypothetical protein
LEKNPLKFLQSVVKNTNIPNHTFIVTALSNANRYNKYARLCAVSALIIPLGIGLLFGLQDMVTKSYVSEIR